MLTTDELKRHVHYDPMTGVFTRLIALHPKAKVGKPTGCRSRTGYISISINGRAYPAARLAVLYMTGDWPKGQADHRNRIRDDNRWENIRDVTPTENNYNTGMYKNNTSGFKGVSKLGDKFKAQARIDGKLKHLGTFPTGEEASKAYQDFVGQFRADFAPTGTHKGHEQEEPHKSKLTTRTI